MGGGGGNSESGEPEFQIAPMIDVLLVLLIFFMSITTANVAVVDKEVVLPVAPDSKKKEKGKERFEVVLNIRWDRSSAKPILSYENRIEGRDITKEQIVDIIKAKKEKYPKEAKVIIRGDQAVPAKSVQEVMNLAATGGIDDISFASLNKK